MKKKICLAAVLLIAIVLFMPFLNGRIAETVSYKLVERANLNSPSRLAIDNYQRGFFRTESLFSWQPKSASGGPLNDDQSIQLKCNGIHKVLSYVYQCKVINLDAYNDFVQQTLAGQDPLSLEGDVSVFGAVTHSFKLNEFVINDDQAQSQIRFYPAQLRVDTDKELSEFNIRGQFKGLDSSSPQGTLSVSGIGLSAVLELNEYQLLIGQANVDFESVQTASLNKGQSTLNGLTLMVETSEQGDNLNALYQLRLDEFLQVNDAPQVEQQTKQPLRDTILDVQLQGVDMAKFVVLKKILVEQAKTKAGNANRNANYLSNLNDFQDLLQPGLTLSTKLTSRHDVQLIDAKFKVALLKQLSFSDFLLLAVNPKGVFKKINLKSTALLPNAFLNNDPALKKAIMQSPLFSQTATAYKSDLTIQGGQVNLNNQAITAEKLLKLISGK